ncbi:MAG: Mrp/NBP35 family ATP-binding protein [Oscillospiraceae bacterium]|jgi:Mrp family chromosome partitioning ATPase|nr:Mrp/NBP35 family ATP-binding protein [Oscillospiraceae bacterium]
MENAPKADQGQELPKITIKRAKNFQATDPPHALSRIKKVIGIVSGKGGVGKSLVTSLLAFYMQAMGHKSGILDADITGPSIPRAFGVSGPPETDGAGMYPVRSRTGIDLMSINFLLPDSTDPVIWRGPVISGAVKQFWTDVIWENEEFLFIDMPPGTGDVALTVFQSIPVNGVIVVTTPQELVGMIVEKAVKMAEKMNIPVLGLVENMSYATCPNCGEKHAIFGESHIDEIAGKYRVKTVCKLPFDPELAALADRGEIEAYDKDSLHALVKMLMFI